MFSRILTTLIIIMILLIIVTKLTITISLLLSQIEAMLFWLIKISQIYRRLKACAQRFRYALFAFIHTYFEYYTLTLRLASLVKKAVIYAYCTKELFDICRENVSHMATLHSVAKHVIHADNLGPRH